MKSCLFALGLSLFSFSAVAEYDPYSLTCVYAADNKLKAVMDSEPDLAYFGMELEVLDGDQQGKKETVELKDLFILYPGEDQIVDAVAKKLASKLNIDFRNVFTISEFIVVDGLPVLMKFYKLNSENGSLGAGIYTEVAGVSTLSLCEE